ncbi:hypothetical protein NMY22_g16829 [Coprinellus aureogranulatus]|nr:hypothetical protein NMY22_g16829 [Coprinellus aureogranulatus]
MSVERINSEENAQFSHILSHATKIPGLVFVSGQVPNDVSGNLIQGNIQDKTTQEAVLNNIGNVLKAAGTSWDKVVKVNVYLKNMDDFAEMNKVYERVVPSPKPARTCIQVRSLRLLSIPSCCHIIPEIARALPRNTMVYKSDYSEHTRLQEKLKAEYVGKTLDDVPTPAFVIDRGIFEENCAAMIRKAKEWGAGFRAHLKTHKTAEGTRLQLVTGEGSTGAVVVSTIKEAWEVFNSGLVKEGIVNDILYGLPVAKNKIADLDALRKEMEPYGGVVTLLLDNPKQVQFLEDAQNAGGLRKQWKAFVKVNGGTNRAGVAPKSKEMDKLVSVILESFAVSLHGFYAHAGNSYASTSLTEAQSYLSGEVQMVNDSALFALGKYQNAIESGGNTSPLVLSVGSTPTAHASGSAAKELVKEALHGTLELHAGNYPVLDLQQQHTSLIDYPRVAQRVRAIVVSYYPGRGKKGEDEALIDAGAIAFSKDTGPSGTFGQVIGKPWVLSRMSQEHGVLSCVDANDPRGKLEIGDFVDIIGQHACLIAAAHPWYYIVEGGSSKIVDIWVPWKGW